MFYTTQQLNIVLEQIVVSGNGSLIDLLLNLDVCIESYGQDE